VPTTCKCMPWWTRSASSGMRGSYSGLHSSLDYCTAPQSVLHTQYR
jgi:hypothetical protein